MALWPDAQHLFWQVSIKIDTPELGGIIRFSQSTKPAERTARFSAAARDRRPAFVPPRAEFACGFARARIFVRMPHRSALQPCKTEVAGDSPPIAAVPDQTGGYFFRPRNMTADYNEVNSSNASHQP